MTISSIFHPVLAQAESAAHGSPQAASESVDIIGHVANGEHPLFHLPTIYGIDLSVTKHVFMLWVVAALVFVTVTAIVRGHLRRGKLVPAGSANVLEVIVDFVRDSMVRPNLGEKWTNAWMPLLLTFFVFILGCNAIGLIPIFDTLALIDHTLIHSAPRFVPAAPDSWRRDGDRELQRHGRPGDGFVLRHHRGGHQGAWVHPALEEHDSVRHALADLLPADSDRDSGNVRAAFRADDATCRQHDGRPHRAVAIMSFVFIFTKMLGAIGGVGIGFGFAVPLAVGISGLEIIVVIVQAYVFTLLTAVFVGMAIHAHH